MLILARKKDESIIIDDNIEISIVEIKGDQVKIGIKAPRSVKIFRHEVYLAIQEANKAAAKSGTELPSIDLLKNP
jgi:carbon storage regulator